MNYLDMTHKKWGWCTVSTLEKFLLYSHSQYKSHCACKWKKKNKAQGDARHCFALLNFCYYNFNFLRSVGLADAEFLLPLTLYVKITYIIAKHEETSGIWCGSDFHNDIFKMSSRLPLPSVESQRSLSTVEPAASILEFSPLQWLDEHLWLASPGTQCSRCFQSAHFPDQVFKNVAINIFFLFPSSKWAQGGRRGWVEDYFYLYLNLVRSPTVHKNISGLSPLPCLTEVPRSMRGKPHLLRRSRPRGDAGTEAFHKPLSECMPKNMISQLSK